jgi:hypothetical protein
VLFIGGTGVINTACAAAAILNRGESRHPAFSEAPCG